MRTQCEIPDCDNDVYAKNKCLKHYYKIKRTGTLNPIKPGPKKSDCGCNVTGCIGELYAKGYCRIHYYRVRNTSTTDPLMLIVKGADRINELGHIWCSKCRQFVPPPRTNPKRWCNACLREGGLIKRYGINAKQFQDLIDAQNNLCLICEQPNPDTIDHDHSCCPGIETCGQCVRGVLHKMCNTMLGQVEPNVDRIIKYLKG